MSIYPLLAIILTTATALLAQSDRLSAAAEPGNASESFQAPPRAFTMADRLHWIGVSTVGPKNLAAGIFVAGFQTWRNEPETYGPHWDGYAKRYGSRLAVGGTSNAIEAGFGSLWGEDPRYRRAASQPTKVRIGHVVKMAFVTHNRAGDLQPAYARYIAVPGGILVSNTWRPDSPSSPGNVSLQVGLGFMSRIISNAFSEFAPNILQRQKHSGNSASREHP